MGVQLVYPFLETRADVGFVSRFSHEYIYSHSQSKLFLEYFLECIKHRKGLIILGPTCLSFVIVDCSWLCIGKCLHCNKKKNLIKCSNAVYVMQHFLWVGTDHVPKSFLHFNNLPTISSCHLYNFYYFSKIY